MHLTNKHFSSLAKSMLFTATLAVSSTAMAQVNSYEFVEMGFLRNPMESAKGIVVTNNRYSEIYLLKNDQLTPMVQGRGCGIYTNMSHDKKLVGFKSINDYDQQAPAVLNVETGIVTLLEDYVHECGQVSFSNDGTMAYTMGNSLIIRKGLSRKAFDLGFYTNIANISPDGSKVAYSNIDGRMFIIDLTTGAKENVAVDGGYDAEWAPDNSKLAIHTADGRLAVMEYATKKIYNLGEGTSASWANSSTELIYTKSERVNEFEIKGNAILKVNFDGSNPVTLITSSEMLPTDAILTSDNKLVTAYKTGIKRGLTVKSLAGGITTMAASVAEEALISFDDETEIGKRLPDFEDSPNAKPSIVPAEGTIGALDIPYLSQIYDVPALSSGCTKYGYVACAPTSASMYLGYYGLLDKHATTSRYDGGTDYYAWHVGRSYTNQKGTKTFSETAYGNGCYGVQGGYGYMWTTSSPRSTFVNYMTLNGCTSSTMQWSSSTGWSAFRTESAAGRPTLLCIALESSGHLILGFRTNCTYTTAGGFVTRTGSFVCHDPYGDCNDSYWGDGDGYHSSYDWIGYNSGRANIGTFYYSCTAVPPTTAVKPSLKCDPASITLEGEVGSTDTKYVDVKVTGEYLSTAISVASATSAITVSKLSGWDDLKGGTLRLTLNTNFSKGAGTYESYVAVQSTSSYRVEIKTTVTLTGGSSTPGEGSTTDVISSMTEKWNYSYANSKTADWITYGSQVTQDMAFNNGKLYVVDKSAAAIYIVDAYTGTKTGALNTSSCSGGAHTLSAVEALGNSIIACNLSNSTSVNLKIYKWTSDAAEPTVMLDAALPAARLGDAMSVSGDETDGKIWFVNGSKAYYYTVTNGTISSTTPTAISLTKDGAEFATTSSYANVTVESDGSFWVASSNLATAHFSATGAYIEGLSLADVQGTDYKSFTLGSKKYSIATSYLKLATPSGASSATLADGAFTLMDITNGISSATTVGTYPSAGLGNIRNTSFRNSLCYEVTSTHVNAWILVPFQGAAYYTFQHTVPGSSSGEVKEAVLSASPASVSLDCNIGETAFTNVTVSGSELHSALKVTSSDSNTFAVVDNTTYNSTDLTVSGTIQIIFKPSAKGTHSGTITVTGTDGNGADKSITIAVTGTATDQSGVMDDNVSSLTEVWNHSYATNSSADWVTFPTQATNDMTFNDGKLYVIHRTSNDDNKIYIVNAYTGTKTGELNTTDCTTGIHYLSGIETIGGKVIACNLQTNIANPLVVYMWDDDNATPTKLLETTERPVARIGDALSVSGDLNDGRLWFVNDSTTFFYPIKNGVCSTTPTIINLTKDGAAYKVSPTYSFNVTVEEDGSFWIISKDYAPTHFTTNGVYIEEISSDILSDKQGTDIKFIKLGTKEYAVATTYLKLATPSGATSATLADGAFTLMDITDGITSATKIDTYPSTGLGNVRNTSFRSSLCTEVTTSNLNVWVLIPMQGAAYYKFQHSTESGVEEIGESVVEEAVEAPVEYYNLQGIKVKNPTNGIYIRVQGSKVSKVLVRE